MQHELLGLKWRRIELCLRYKLKTLSTNFVCRVTLNVEYIFVECRGGFKRKKSISYHIICICRILDRKIS